MRKAVVNSETNVVVNVIVYDPEGSWSPPEGYILVDANEAGGIGDTWDGERFVAIGEKTSPWWKKQPKKAPRRKGGSNG